MAEQSLRKGKVRGSSPLIGSNMKSFYSRRTKVEEKKNIRSAVIFSILSIALVVAFIFFGLPAVVKVAGFLLDLKKSSQSVDVTDTTPPPPPRLQPLPTETNIQEAEIRGSTEPGATVVVSINARASEVLANKEGEFSFNFSLKEGENTIFASAKDSSGNESQKTETLKITYDNKPPDLEIGKPQDRAEFFGAKQRQIVIEGNTEEGVGVNVNARQVVVEGDGTFSFATTLSEGENTFLIKAQDKAGNATEKSITLFFTP